MESADYVTAEQELEFGEDDDEEIQISLKLKRTVDVTLDGEYEEGDKLLLTIEDTFGHVLEKRNITTVELDGLELSDF